MLLCCFPNTEYVFEKRTAFSKTQYVFQKRTASSKTHCVFKDEVLVWKRTACWSDIIGENRKPDRCAVGRSAGSPAGGAKGADSSLEHKRTDSDCCSCSKEETEACQRAVCWAEHQAEKLPHQIKRYKPLFSSIPQRYCSSWTLLVLSHISPFCIYSSWGLDHSVVWTLALS